MSMELKTMAVFLVIFLAVLCYGIFLVARLSWVSDEQKQFLRSYKFSPALLDRFQKEHPELSVAQQEMVFSALKTYFIICHQAGSEMVAMPSRIVDAAWHEFILFTKEYESFCQKAFAKFFHHTPTEAMASNLTVQNSIRLAWRLACYQEDIVPRSPDRLPLLFAIDQLLQIKDGFYYSLDCLKDQEQEGTSASNSSNSYCIANIACGSGDSSGSGCCGNSCGGSGDSSGSGCCGNSCGGSGDSSGSGCCGNSCGGGGCGGG